MIVGNKRDRGEDRQVTAAEGRAMADALGVLFAEVSALSGERRTPAVSPSDVIEAFQQLLSSVDLAQAGFCPEEPTFEQPSKCC